MRSKHPRSALFKFQNPRNTTLHRFSQRPVGSTHGSERTSISVLRGPNGRIRCRRTGVGADVKEMAQKLLHYRTTLPDQLKATFTSILSSQRPPFLEFVSGSEPEASGESTSGQSRVLLAQGDHETSEKISLLKQKISSNVSTILVLLKRLNECMSMVDKLDSYNGIMHPAFKRKRTS